MRFKWWQLAVVVAVAVGFVVLLFVVSEVGRSRLVAAEADVLRAQVQLTRVVDLCQVLMNAESGHRGYLLTGDPSHLRPFHRASERIDELSSRLTETYQGKDEQVGAAIRQLGGIARTRMSQMEESAEIYRQQGPAAGLELENLRSRHETMATFRELAGIARDYEQALVDRSLEKLERELAIVARLNLATLLVGLVLAALAAVAISRSMRQREQAAAELVRQHGELKAQFDAQARELNDLARHLQHAQEEERARLSQGLHDELGGVLLAARMDVSWIQQHIAGGDVNVKQRLERVQQVLDQGIDLKRRVVEELQIEETCRRANLRCIERFPDEEPRLNRNGAIALFRVVQEGLANVVKHAKASEVNIALDLTGDEVVVTIRDDGVGTSPDALSRPRSHGIAGMRHRVNVLEGRLEITSGPSGGTTVQVRVPLANVTEEPGIDSGESGTFAALASASGPASTT